MYRIRFHGRGGEGMKTSSRILGTSFFNEGFEVQDAPRYGAERRGAPVFAYVRADRKTIYERGIIHNPDLIIIADDTLINITPETVLEGVTERTLIFAVSGMEQEELDQIIPIKNKLIILNPQMFSFDYRMYLSSICASAAARLTGKINLNTVIRSITEEIQPMDHSIIKENVLNATRAFDEMAPFDGILTESDQDRDTVFNDPHFIDLSPTEAELSTPVVRRAANSFKSPTGSWRTIRPVIDKTGCSRCMLCNVHCPDSAISAGEDGFPVIDYSHCKGCLICAEVCPAHAISRLDESLFRKEKSLCHGN